MDEFKPVQVKILDRTVESPDTITLRVDWKVKHAPGQFAQLSVLGIGECPISFCSFSEDFVFFNADSYTSVKVLQKFHP